MTRLGSGPGWSGFGSRQKHVGVGVRLNCSPRLQACPLSPPCRLVRLLPRPGYESGTVYSLPWCGYVSTTVGRALLILPKIRLAEIRLWEAWAWVSLRASLCRPPLQRPLYHFIQACHTTCYITGQNVTTVLYNTFSMFLLYSMLHNRVLWRVLRQVLFVLLSCYVWHLHSQAAGPLPQLCQWWYFGSSITCPYFSVLPRIWVNRDAGNKGPAVGSLAAWWTVLSVFLYSTQRSWMSSCWSCRFPLLRRCLDLPCQKQSRWVILLYTLLNSTVIYHVYIAVLYNRVNNSVTYYCYIMCYVS